MAQPRRILVVEDEPDLRVTLSEVLALNGYEVESASNGREALRRELQTDVELRSIPIVILSGADDLVDETEDPQLGALQKPFEIGAVIDMVERYGAPPSSRPPPIVT